MTGVTRFGTLATLALVGTALTPTVRAQGVKVPPSAKVDIVVERYQADKKIASLPYSLWVTKAPTGGPPQALGSLRIGVSVPIGVETSTSGNGPNSPTRNEVTTTRTNYQDVGTQIDCTLYATVDDHYWLNVNLRDSSLYDGGSRAAGLTGRGGATPPPAPALRSFQFNGTVEMRDGQTAEFENATDKISGEVVKTLVTLTIAK